jgi:hypothetical protein
MVPVETVSGINLGGDMKESSTESVNSNIFDLLQIFQCTATQHKNNKIKRQTEMIRYSNKI